MQINGAVVFVTGSNRGLGKALVAALKARGAAKIYASSRTGEPIQGTTPIHLDITKRADIIAAARIATDTTILINNAGINFNVPPFNRLNEDYAILEMDIHYFETLAMCQDFSPILGENGGGAIVNVAPIARRVAFPAISSLNASKAALIDLSQSLRAKLAQQQTEVVLVMPGHIDVDSSIHARMDIANPADVVDSILDAVEDGIEELYPDAVARFLAHQQPANCRGVERNPAGYPR